jgi:MFS family permease
MDAAGPPSPVTLTISSADRWRTYVLCLLGWLFDFYDLILFAYVSGEIAKEWNWGAQATHHKAVIVGAALATSGLGGIVFGRLADRYGRKRIMTWTILLYSISTGLCAIATGFWSLLFFRSLTGLGVGGEWATGHALMAEIFPKEKRGRASALLQAGEPLGVALAVVTGLVLAPRLGWRWVFLLSSLPAVLVLFVRRHAVESPVWLARKDIPREPFLEPYREVWRSHRKRALLAWVLGVTKLGTYWLSYVWFQEYFAEIEHEARAQGHVPAVAWSAIKITFILLAQAGQFIGMLIFGSVADKVGRRPAFCLFSAATAAGLWVLVGFGPDLMRHPALFWPTMMTIGLGSGCTAGFGALLAELFPTSVRNTAMGAVYNLARAFQLVNQQAMALIALHFGFSTGMGLAACLAMVTATWVWVLPETRGRELEH